MIALRWWTCDPKTGRDLFDICDGCSPAEPHDWGRREFQRRVHCPLIPREEWVEPIDIPEQTRSGPAAKWTEDLDICPGAYARSPAAIEAGIARQWWEHGSLSALYPGDPPQVVVDAIKAANGANGAWREEGERLRDEERESHRKQRDR